MDEISIELLDEIAQETYGKNYLELCGDRQKTIMQLYQTGYLENG